jgi:hypothetical protein
MAFDFTGQQKYRVGVFQSPAAGSTVLAVWLTHDPAVLVATSGGTAAAAGRDAG